MNFALCRNYIYTRKALQYYSFQKAKTMVLECIFSILAYKQQKNSFSIIVITQLLEVLE